MTGPRPAWHKLGAFFLALAVVFGAAFGLGRAIDPTADDPPARAPVDLHGGHP